eukprot:CAMPEP_0117061534 /NCGR_PEP_ID=MMETSP0472-20121206/42831_1 /TAXON_ID=693140 ORGANISM="Tiarina fusus, Strain LIS" /NCGR_SAMPLE_ID=MMETSP0472 /ASSEMBLY_ACC=CAM_ASM_000603 /LENGTH=197 /DNA_ID=CAMNT_0004780233 /DNA_START=32 /DNA_END=621 /DNA_ORIENTATION=-
MNIQKQVAKFTQNEIDAKREDVQSKFISENSDRKKYNFVSGLDHDVKSTRTTISQASGNNSYCTFGDVFSLADEMGGIANLSRALQNLKKTGEIYFEPEIMYQGMHKNERIEILDGFKNEGYKVTEENCFQKELAPDVVPQELRRGRSYIQENMATSNVNECCLCQAHVAPADRMTVRGKVFHVSCLSCAQCSAPIR